MIKSAGYHVERKIRCVLSRCRNVIGEELSTTLPIAGGSGVPAMSQVKEFSETHMGG